MRRHRGLWIIPAVAAFAWIGWIAKTQATPLPLTLASAPAGAQSPELCPYQTPEEWQKFLEHYADDEDWVKTCEDSACDADYYAFVKKNVEGIFEKCKGFLANHPRIAGCADSMRRFTPVWLRQHDDVSYGFADNNATYLASQEAADQPPGMMKIPDAIVEALPDRVRVEQAARENGFKYLTHDSALGGYRTFIYVPDPQGRFDQWMLLNLQAGDSKVEKGTPLSILAVQKKDRAGNSFKRVRLHFRDYVLNPEKSGFSLSVNPTGNGKCYGCHVNGVRQLIARRTSILEAFPVRGEEDALGDDFAYRRLLEFNRRLRSYGTPDWHGEITPEDNGPVLGRAQSCTDCHNGASRASLTVLTSPKQLRQKMYFELGMPPDTSLPRLIERKDGLGGPFSLDMAATLKEAYGAHAALVKDFESSRLPALKEWFLRTPCR